MNAINRVRGLSRPSQQTNAFALVLTLVLIVFLAGLLAALATLSGIEASLSTQALKQATARQHALMGVTLALGQLQKYAGPDTRVTAAAEAFSPPSGTSHFTGVWDSAAADIAPMTWLVSGAGHDASGGAPTSAGALVELVGRGTTGQADEVRVPLQAIPVSQGSVANPAPAIGHYAWWIGDEGVKASVATPGNLAQVTYPPFDSPERQSRLRQQGLQGAGPTDAAGLAVFEPRDSLNAPLLPRIAAFNQLAFLKVPDGSGEIGPELITSNFHAWTTNQRAVLADTKLGGLKRDLSLKPTLLGDAFAAWADYGQYMEDPAAPRSPAPLPAFASGNPGDALRRRYRLTASRTDAGISHGVAPVLSYFLLTFNVRTDQAGSGSVRPLEVRARWLVTLWNPYSSGLTPEDLELEIFNLPSFQVVNDTTGASSAAISLASLYGAPLHIALPWTPGGRADQQTWLPGRVYTWAAKEDLNKTSPLPSAGFPSIFYTRNLSTAAGQGVQRSVSSVSMANSAQAHLQGESTQLSVSLFRSNATGERELLGTFTGPSFNAFTTTPGAINAATYQFSYVFHLAESTDTPATPEAWLTAPGPVFVPAANGPRPELYPNYAAIAFPDRLLDRALPAGASSSTGQSYNEDTPLFELPRSPVLSMGALQHVHVTGARSFAIGNSWGDVGGWNAVFDHYFFSGLTSAVTASPLPVGAALPSPLLSLIPRKADGSATAWADLLAESTSGLSSKYLWQDGAFNVNAVNPAAWRAVLRSGRLSGGSEFKYLAATAGSGTAGDTAPESVDLPDAVFFRFPFSAQETYKADAGFATSSTVPPAAPNQASPANTHLFRRGVRALSAAHVAALANVISELVILRQSAAGPFRSLEEFLAPSALFDGVSLLEKALATVVTPDGRHINGPADVPEFSSQFLTQGDLMTALAPTLVVRSDTFRIRAYGDVANPATGRIEARAWAEALVQRVPSYVDESQDPSTARESLTATNLNFGRRFKIISFRWLDHSDI